MIVATAQDAAALFAPCFAASATETLAVAHLDAEGRLIELIVADAFDHAAFRTRIILEDALRLGAERLVVAHNHPGGDAQPSEEDLEATRELADTASRLGIRLLDHLIFAGEETSSLREQGLL